MKITIQQSLLQSQMPVLERPYPRFIRAKKCQDARLACLCVTHSFTKPWRGVRHVDETERCICEALVCGHRLAMSMQGGACLDCIYLRNKNNTVAPEVTWNSSDRALFSWLNCFVTR